MFVGIDRAKIRAESMIETRLRSLHGARMMLVFRFVLFFATK